MNVMMLPYFCQLNQQSVLLKLNERGELCIHRRNRQEEWQPEEVLSEECRCFAAAPDPGGNLHVIAVNGKRKLTYFLINEDQANQLPFIVKESPHHIILSFSALGRGYFFSSDSSNRLITVKFTPATGWREEKQAITESESVPVGLITDRSGRLHLITFSLADGSLTYRCSITGQKWTDPFPLDSALQLSMPPALYLDANLNLHAAWYVPRNRSICYRLKKAGGWPQGGWQPEQYLQTNEPVHILSFQEQPESLKIWCLGNAGQVRVFSRHNSDWEGTEHETGLRLPVRQGIPGGELYNLADSVPAKNWFFSMGQEQVKAEQKLTPDGQEQITDNTATGQEDKEQRLLEQIMELMEDNRNLKAALSKKDETLAQYQIMLEEENYKKQQSEWKVTIKKLEERISQLEEESKRRESEIRSYREQAERAQQQLSARETEQKRERAEIVAMRGQITQYQQQKAALSSTIRKLEQELDRKKGVLGSITSVFRKKE